MPGGSIPSDDDLLERTLRFSGSYVSDDGHVRIRRSSGAGGYSAPRYAAPRYAAPRYSAPRYLGRCESCARSGLTSRAGEPLTDAAAVLHFVAAHDHGDVD